jgi:hypothetical protein
LTVCVFVLQRVASKAEASLAELQEAMRVPAYVDRVAAAVQAKDAARAAELAARAATATQTAEVLASALVS